MRHLTLSALSAMRTYHNQLNGAFATRAMKHWAFLSMMQRLV
jgi:hypothetical protein